MIAYLIGEITEVGEGSVVIEVNHIGYNVRVSTDTSSRLAGVSGQVKLYTYTSVREDAFWLYGFLSKGALDIFKLCITVNGIGPKGALSLLSVLDENAFRFAVMSGDVKTIATAPGIGKKTAERLIIDLKDKISLEDTLPYGNGDTGTLLPITGDSEQAAEALEALVSLGYGRSEALKALSSLENKNEMDAGEILKAALKKML